MNERKGRNVPRLGNVRVHDLPLAVPTLGAGTLHGSQRPRQKHPLSN